MRPPKAAFRCSRRTSAPRRPRYLSFAPSWPKLGRSPTALNARRIGSAYRTYVLLGDGETAEGSVWEAADTAAVESLDNLCGITDVNALGQSGPTMWRHDMPQLAHRWSAFGWHTIVIDGHDMVAIVDAFAEARRTPGRPTMILARTIKWKGVSFVEGKDGWHGKAFKKGEEADRAIAELKTQIVEEVPRPAIPPPPSRSRPEPAPDYSKMPAPSYKPGEQVATREAWGTALAALGTVDQRVVVLDADVKNSTFSERFRSPNAISNAFRDLLVQAGLRPRPAPAADLLWMAQIGLLFLLGFLPVLAVTQSSSCSHPFE